MHMMKIIVLELKFVSPSKKLTKFRINSSLWFSVITQRKPTIRRVRTAQVY